MGKLMYLVSNDMRNTIRFCSFGLNGILFDIRQWMKESQVKEKMEKEQRHDFLLPMNMATLQEQLKRFESEIVGRTVVNYDVFVRWMKRIQMSVNIIRMQLLAIGSEFVEESIYTNLWEEEINIAYDSMHQLLLKLCQDMVVDEVDELDLLISDVLTSEEKLAECIDDLYEYEGIIDEEDNKDKYLMIMLMPNVEEFSDLVDKNTVSFSPHRLMTLRLGALEEGGRPKGSFITLKSHVYHQVEAYLEGNRGSWTKSNGAFKFDALQ